MAISYHTYHRSLVARTFLITYLTNHVTSLSLFKYNLYWTFFSSFSFGSWSPTRNFYKLRTWLREVTAFPLFSAFPEISAIKVPEKEIAMLLMQDRSRIMSVVHLDSIVRAVHLLPVFNGDAPIPREINFTHTLNVFQSFYLNKYIDYHAFETLC